MPKAARLLAPGNIQIEERERLKPDRHEAVIEVETAGICGTDLALFSGDYKVPLPLVPGHEFVGRVTSVGDWVDEKWIGRRVAGEINNSCISRRKHIVCAACTKNIPNHCLERSVTGIINHDGAFAEEVCVPGSVLHEIPEDLDVVAAALTEPLAAALQTFEATPLRGDETVAVLGPGRLGALIVFAAALKGAKVIAVSRSEKKRSRALKLGAERALSVEDSLEGVKEFTNGLGADVVIDATGQREGFQQALELVRPRGTVSLKTTCGLSAPGIDVTRLVVDEVTIQGTRCGPFEPAVKILQKYQDRLKPLITSQRSLEDAQAAIESAATEDKVVFRIGK